MNKQEFLNNRFDEIKYLMVLEKNDEIKVKSILENIYHYGYYDGNVAAKYFEE